MRITQSQGGISVNLICTLYTDGVGFMNQEGKSYPLYVELVDILKYRKIRKDSSSTLDGQENVQKSISSMTQSIQFKNNFEKQSSI